MSTSTPKGTREFATLLSIQQTLRYRGMSFLEFLRSDKMDISDAGDRTIGGGRAPQRDGDVFSHRRLERRSRQLTGPPPRQAVDSKPSQHVGDAPAAQGTPGTRGIVLVLVVVLVVEGSVPGCRPMQRASMSCEPRFIDWSGLVGRMLGNTTISRTRTIRSRRCFARSRRWRP